MKAWTITLTISLIAGLSASGAEPIYFLSETAPLYAIKNSFILPLTNEADIAIARDLIQKGYDSGEPYSQNAQAMTIVPGRDGINRNYADPSLPEWSWHVQNFWAFAEAVSDNTTASELENSYDWKNNPPASVTTAFEFYRITRELGPIPLFLSTTMSVKNLDFYWSTPLTNGQYTLQQNPGFASNAWTSVPGFSWPVATNHVSFAQTNAVAMNFRVQAK